MKFSSYKAEGYRWITAIKGEQYPDYVPQACDLYAPVLTTFGAMLAQADSAINLLKIISETSNKWLFIQLIRVFRRYVSPETPVEMLKHKRATQKICNEFGQSFRPINDVKRAFESRKMPDEAICSLLWENNDRGKKGYDLTEQMFRTLREMFPTLVMTGPERAGKDVLLGTIFPDYPNPARPVDFVISNDTVLSIGLARYDSDRGGSQEDDRTGQYRDCATEIFRYTTQHDLKTKLIFVNDGPGLLLGSMWNDYAQLEDLFPERVKVTTLRMMPERLTYEWLTA